MNSYKGVTFLFSSADDRGRNSRTTVFQLTCGPTIVHRVVERKEPLRHVAAAYGVSHETIRRIIRHVLKQLGQQEA